MLKIRPTRSRWRLPWETTTEPSPRSDDELLTDAGAGDHAALTTLNGRVAGLVYANIRSVLHDTARTDTVAADAFVEVQRQAAGYDPSRTPAVIWILDLAHQLATECDRSGDAPVAAGPGADPGTTTNYLPASSRNGAAIGSTLTAITEP